MELIRSFIVVCGYLSSVSRAEFIDWCASLLHCAELKNTMCAYGDEDSTAGNCSDQKDLIQGSQYMIEYWLALHNTFRDQVAAGFVPGMPSASNMMQLKWNDVLTSQARRWAFQCMYQDDPCSRSPEYNHMEPEIVHNETRLLGDLVRNVRAAVLTRFLEDINGYRSYPNSLVDKVDETGFHSYQQVNLAIHVFAAIRHIGASLVLYKWSEDGALHPFLRSNTYYGPPILEGPVYKRGTPCSDCPDGFKCNRKSTYTYLCAAPKDPTRGEYTGGLPGAMGRNNLATSLNSGPTMLLALIGFAPSLH